MEQDWLCVACRHLNAGAEVVNVINTLDVESETDVKPSVSLFRSHSTYAKSRWIFLDDTAVGPRDGSGVIELKSLSVLD